MNRHLTAILLAAAAAAPLRGQSTRADSVPTGYQPPAGMCRVWVDGVPAAQQPAPTDCNSAMRSRPAKSRVLIGEGIPSGSLPYNAFSGQIYPANPTGGNRARPFADPDDRRRLGGDLCHADASGNCDDTAPGVAGCIDANQDGRCDDGRRDIPGMIEAGAFRAGSVLGGICIDRNRDGKCDETWLAADVCLDKDGDGKCDGPMATLVKPTEPATVKPEPAADKSNEKRKPNKRPE
jgi:hypothetical protein